MVQKTTRKRVLMPFLAIWAPPNGPQKVHQGPQVGRMYDPVFRLKKSPQPNHNTNSFRRNGPKQLEYSFSCFFCGHLVDIWAPPNGPKKVDKVPQVG
jgi:hypothetical protein